MSFAGTLDVAGGKLTITAALSVNNLILSGGNLDPPDVTVDGNFDWTGGILAAAGMTMVASTGTLDVSGASTVTLDGSLQNDGTAMWTGSADIDVNGGTVTNDGTFTADSSSQLAVVGASGSNAFVNSGTFMQDGSGSTTLPTSSSGVDFNNAGTVDVTAGTLSLDAGGTNTGSFAVTGGATLDLSGIQTVSGTISVSAGSTLSLGAGTTVINTPQAFAGTLSLPAGTVLTANATVSAGGLTLSGGTLNGSGTLTVNGTLNWTGGTIAGTGKTIISGMGNAVLGGNSTLDLDGALENDGTVNNPGQEYIAEDGGTFTNDGSFIADSPSNLQIEGIGGTNAFINNGTFIQKGIGTTTFTSGPSGVLFGGSGNIDVLAGTLSVQDNSSFTNNGNITVAAASQLDFAGNFTQTSAGSFTVQAGGNPSAGQFGQIVCTGNASLAGTLNLQVVNSLLPVSGATYPVITSAGSSGAFTTVTGGQFGSVPGLLRELHRHGGGFGSQHA